MTVELGRRWLGAPEGEDLALIAELDALLDVGRDDPLLYCHALPRCPERMIERYCECMPSRFAAVWRRLIGHAADGLPFELCGNVARLHVTAFGACREESLRRQALQQLLRLGRCYSSYAVADAVRELLLSAGERDAALIAEVLRESPDAWWYVHPRVFERSLSPAIAGALRSAVTSGRHRHSSTRCGAV